MPISNLDIDLLRTFVVATDLGGFVHAASRLNRSQSAISLQMKKLEDQVGLQLFRREGRGVALSETGDLLLGYARRILDLNDEALSVAKGAAIEGVVKLGVLPDLPDDLLAAVFARFNAAHPLIHVQLQVERSRELFAAIAQGKLDLALGLGEAEHVASSIALPTVWIARKGIDLSSDAPLPLALLASPCVFRQMGIEALERTRRPWRLAFTSPSVPSLWAAVQAGLGLTIRTPLGLPENLIQLTDAGLPELPGMRLVLCSKSRRLSVAAERLRTILSEELAAAFDDAPAVFSPQCTSISQMDRSLS